MHTNHNLNQYITITTTITSVTTLVSKMKKGNFSFPISHTKRKYRYSYHILRIQNKQSRFAFNITKDTLGESFKVSVFVS